MAIASITQTKASRKKKNIENNVITLWRIIEIKTEKYIHEHRMKSDLIRSGTCSACNCVCVCVWHVSSVFGSIAGNCATH